MATILLDLDGTIVRHGTNELLPGRLEQMQAAVKAGHQIIFLTRRGMDWSSDHIYGRRRTEQFLRELEAKGIPGRVLFDVESPRLVINDQGARGVEVEKNGEWTFDLTQLAGSL